MLVLSALMFAGTAVVWAGHVQDWASLAVAALQILLGVFLVFPSLARYLGWRP
jgi:hypothetical protein